VLLTAGSAGPDGPGAQHVIGSECDDSVHCATRAGDHDQRRVIGCTGQLAAVYHERGKVEVVEWCLLQPFDGSDAENSLGDGLPVGDDKVDLGVVGPGPVPTYNAFCTRCGVSASARSRASRSTGSMARPRQDVHDVWMRESTRSPRPRSTSAMCGPRKVSQNRR
jgi:hypothetical protein